MENVPEWLLLVLPVILAELGLKGVSLADLTGRERTRGPKWVWGPVILLVNLVGSLAYLAFGRME